MGCLWASRRLDKQEVKKKSSVSHSNDVAKIFFLPLKTKEFKDKVDSYLISANSFRGFQKAYEGEI